MTKQVGDERAIRLRNPDAYELHSVARSRLIPLLMEYAKVKVGIAK